jgi:hypothetical protein
MCRVVGVSVTVACTSAEGDMRLVHAMYGVTDWNSMLNCSTKPGLRGRSVHSSWHPVSQGDA